MHVQSLPVTGRQHENVDAKPGPNPRQREGWRSMLDGQSATAADRPGASLASRCQGARPASATALPDTLMTDPTEVRLDLCGEDLAYAPARPTTCLVLDVPDLILAGGRTALQPVLTRADSTQGWT